MKKYKGLLPEIELKFKKGDTYKCQIKESKDIFDLLSLLYNQDTVELTESMIAIYLNRANNTIGWFKVSSGGLVGTVIDNRLILATALKCGASSIIISHNHPSGSLQPSSADISITNLLKLACKTMEMDLLDHIIYTPEGYYSFADEGLL